MLGFGQRLKETIKKSNYTQKEIAKLINISEDSMSLYVKEKKYPDIQKVYAICEILKIEPNYLIIGKNSDLTQQEEKLLEYFRSCNPGNREIILNAAKGLKENEENNQQKSSDLRTG